MSFIAAFLCACSRRYSCKSKRSKIGTDIAGPPCFDRNEDKPQRFGLCNGKSTGRHLLETFLIKASLSDLGAFNNNNKIQYKEHQ